VYVANEDCTISVIAVARSTPQVQPKVIDTIPVDDCANTAPIAPWGLAVTPDGTAVYVAYVLAAVRRTARCRPECHGGVGAVGLNTPATRLEPESSER
jgi:DNA-binding beta-propeller fold protein YncE